MKTTFRHILLSLALYDALFSLLATITFSLPCLSSHWRVWIMPLLLPYIIPGLQMALNGSIWSTVMVALERYLSIGHPSQRLFDESLLFILPVTLLTVAWNIPKFFEFKTCYIPLKALVSPWNEVISNWTEEFNMTGDTVVYPQLCSTPLRDNYRYSRDYLLIANFLVMAFIPLLLLIIFNSLTFKIIRASSLTNARTSTRQRRDQGIASMFIFIVIIFVICNLPRMFLNMLDVLLLATGLDFKNGWPEWSNYLSTFSNFLLVLNSSINIFIYSWKDKKFRKILRNKFFRGERINGLTNSNTGRTNTWRIFHLSGSSRV